MTSVNNTFCIEANPDISGIGVRVAIYVQNALSFVPAISALSDGKVSLTELDSVETQSMSILIMAYAILLSTIIQALTAGLSNLHATIVLNLSWMNNTNTFIYFLLYVHHMIHPDPSLGGQERVAPNWTSWYRHVKERCLSRLGQSAVMDEAHEMESEQKMAKNSDSRASQKSSVFKGLFRELILPLGSLHLSIMAGVGIWLWCHPGHFGKLASSSCPLQEIEVVVLGKSLPFSSRGLRIWSLFMYILVLLPGINLLLPIVFFLAPFVFYIRRWLPKPGLIRVTDDQSVVDTNVNNRVQKPSLIPISAGLVFLGLIDLAFVIDIELSIQHNPSLQQPDETSWTFGQTLALLLLLINFRDVIEALSERRDQRRIQEHTTSLKNALRSCDADAIEDLVRKGADVDADVDGAEFPTALQFASYHGKLDLARIVTDRGCNVNFKGGNYGTALEAASLKGNALIVKLLLDRGADVNIQAGDYGTALGAAARGGHIDIVKLLLDREANVDSPAGGDDTALGAAASNGNAEIVKFLLDRGGNVNSPAGEYGTPLGAAAYWGETQAVKLLLDRGADVNRQGGEYGTALRAAVFCRHVDTVKFLLDNGAYVNIQGAGDYQIEKQSWNKNVNLKKTVKLLREKQPNVRIKLVDGGGNELQRL